MEKEELFVRLMEIADFAKPNKKGGHHNRHHGEDKSSRTENDGEKRDKKPKDPLRMPPSAKCVLTTLLHEEKLNQRTIAKNTNVTAQGISDMLKKLEKDELITKEVGNSHNENFVMLTEKGKVVACEIKQKTKVHAEKMFKNFTAQELAMLENMLEKIYKNSEEQ